MVAKKRKQYPSQARLRELFDYDPEGFLVWRWRGDALKRVNTRFAGEIAGSIHVSADNSVTRRINIDGKPYNALRIMWIYHYGDIPEGFYVKTKGDIYSCINKDALYLTPSQSITNSARRSGGWSASKYKGVYLHNQKKHTGEKTYKAQMTTGKKSSLGVFRCPHAAAACWNAWAKEHYGASVSLNETPITDDFEAYRVDLSTCRIKRGKHGLRGVYKRSRKWKAQMGSAHLGTYTTKEEAARAYNRAARDHYGDHAVLNDVPDPFGDGDVF